VVGAVSVELAGGRVHRQRDAVAAGAVPDGLDRGNEQREHVFGSGDVGGEPALVAEAGRVSGIGQLPLQYGVDLRTGADRLGDAGARRAGQHKLLKVEIVGRVHAAVDDVEVRDGECRPHAMGRQVAPEGSPAAIACARATAIETPTMAFAPSRDLSGVPSSAMSTVSTPATSNERPQRVCAISPFTCPTAFRTPCPPNLVCVAVAKLFGLAGAGRGAGRNTGPRGDTADKLNGHRQRRPRTRVQNLDRGRGLNRGHSDASRILPMRQLRRWRTVPPGARALCLHRDDLTNSIRIAAQSVD
jgi:hypothetical protein